MIENEYSKNNYLKLQPIYDKSLSNQINSYNLCFPSPNFLQNLPPDELFEYYCIKAATEIEQNLKNYYLLFSGGVDSQAMAMSFIKAKLKPTLLIMRYIKKNEGYHNQFDLDSVTKFISLNIENINYEYIDIDLDYFYNEGLHQKYADSALCSSPQLTVHFWVQDLVNKPCVLSWNLPNICSYRSHKYIFLPDYKFFSYLRYLEYKKKSGVPYFFLYSPEMLYSSLLISSLKNELNKAIPANYVTPYKTKVTAYCEAGFSVQAQSQKYTGFENYKKYYSEINNTNDIDFYNKKLRYPLIKKYNDSIKINVSLDLSFFKEYFSKDNIRLD